MVKSLLQEITLQKDYLAGEPVHTIYFGGGTPSLLQAGELQALLTRLFATFPVTPGAEITLEANPDAEDDKNAPPQKLAIAFSTADVVVLGWRLGLLADRLQENDLAAVRALPKRYADVDRHTPFVASITVTSIDAGKDRNSPK